MKRFKKFIPLVAVIAMAIPTVAYADMTNTYKVQPGDTLWTISQKYKVDLEDMVGANPQFVNPDLIYPDDVVNIPDASDNGSIGASMTSNNSNNTSNAKVGSNASVQSTSRANDTESQVAQLVNKERAKQGLAPLNLSSDISNIARVKSEDMRNKKYFSHQSPTYGSPFDMLASFGIKYKSAGENIAKGQKTADAVMKAWMNSEGHRKNIMNPNYKEIGVGYVTDSAGTTYWTQQFVTR